LQRGENSEKANVVGAYTKGVKGGGSLPMNIDYQSFDKEIGESQKKEGTGR